MNAFPGFHRFLKPFLGEQVDPAHPLVRGMAFDAIFAEGGGPARDSITGVVSAAVPGTWTGGPRGPAVAFNGASNQASFGDRASWRPGGDFTFSVYANPIGESTARAGIAKRQTSGTFPQLSLVFNSDANGNTSAGSWCLLNRDGVTNVHGASVSGLDGGWHRYTGSSARGVISLYLDNAPVAVSTYGSGVPNYMGSDPLCVGSGNAALYFARSIAHATYWTRALSAAEVAWFHEEPFGYYAPPTTRRLYTRPMPSPVRPTLVSNPWPVQPSRWLD